MHITKLSHIFVRKSYHITIVLFSIFLLNYTNLVYDSFRFRTKYNCNSKRSQASASSSIDGSYNVTIIKLPTEGLGTLTSNLNHNKLYYSSLLKVVMTHKEIYQGKQNFFYLAIRCR